MGINLSLNLNPDDMLEVYIPKLILVLSAEKEEVEVCIIKVQLERLEEKVEELEVQMVHNQQQVLEDLVLLYWLYANT